MGSKPSLTFGLLPRCQPGLFSSTLSHVSAYDSESFHTAFTLEEWRKVKRYVLLVCAPLTMATAANAAKVNTSDDLIRVMQKKHAKSWYKTLRR